MRTLLLVMAVASILSASAIAQQNSRKDCGDHICTKTEGHKLVENRKDGNLIDCRIEFVARALGAPYAFAFVASANEGEILPFMRIVIRGVHLTPGDAPNEELALRSVYIVGGDSKFTTVDWDKRTLDGAVWLRTDVLPEDRAMIATLANIATSETFAMLVNTADAGEMKVGVVQLDPKHDIARRFLACTEELRRSVGG